MTPGLKIRYQVPELPASPADLAASLDDGRAVLCKNRPKITAGCFGGCFIKRYNLPGLQAKVKRCFRRGRPERARLAAEFLRRAGVPTPPVLATMRETGFCGRDYLVTAELPETAVTLDKYYAALAPEAAQRALLTGAAALLVQLHRSGFFHGDVNLRNLYFLRDTGEYGVIDLDSARCYRREVPAGARILELARLGSSYTALDPEFNGLAAAALLTAAYCRAGGSELPPEAVRRRMEYLLSGHGKVHYRRTGPPDFAGDRKKRR